MIPRNLPTQENPAEIILHAVIAHERQVGISTIALILKGSRAKQVSKRQLFNSRFFGALFYQQVDIIENFIKQLINKGAIKIVNMNIGPFFTPVLEISEEGKKILENKTSIELQTKHNPVQPAILTNSIKETLDLFQEFKSVKIVAEKRNLTESTIWEHLATCIKLRQLRPSDVVEESKIKLILETKQNLKLKGLKQFKAALPEDISYGEIRCAIVNGID